MARWHDTASASAGWVNAPATVQLQELLDVAREECLEWAPIPAADAVGLAEGDCPIRYRVAQLMQVRALWEAGKAGPSAEGIGSGEYMVPVRPLSWAIKNVLRPPSAVSGLVG